MAGEFWLMTKDGLSLSDKNYIENNETIECAWFKTKKERDEKMLQELADRNGF